jgi:hypothetical protein
MVTWRGKDQHHGTIHHRQIVLALQDDPIWRAMHAEFYIDDLCHVALLPQLHDTWDTPLPAATWRCAYDTLP